ncbi:MAG: Gfo/Idh/MocA family oxidoreductase [Nitrososphaerota archaeon]|nr:Gfo/Idh/MocA family oxidoreductase [Nitrososphaerota archaeon]
MGEPSRNNPQRNETRVAVVGCGKMGLLHTSLLNTLPGVSIVALCEKSPRLTRFIRKMISKDTKVVNDVDDLSGLDLDVIYVTTPIPSHHAIVKNILEKDITSNVFTEKTLGGDYTQSQQLRRLIEERKGVSMVGYHKRFGVTFGKAMKILSSGEIGKVTSFEAFAYSSDFASKPESSDSSLARGGVLRDLGCHAIDLALWYFGDLTLSNHNASSKTLSSDDVEFGVTTSDGVSGEIKASWRKPNFRMPVVGVNIIGTQGSVQVNDDKLALKTNDGVAEEWYRASLEDNVDFLLGGPEYFREDAYFISAIARGSNSVSDFASASKVDSIIERAIQQ